MSAVKKQGWAGTTQATEQGCVTSASCSIQPSSAEASLTADWIQSEHLLEVLAGKSPGCPSPALPRCGRSVNAFTA